MVDSALFSADSEEWGTPQGLFDELERRFCQPFNLDAAASHSNHKCDYYFTKEDDGLAQEWKGLDGFSGQAFVNPPYGPQIKDWVEKAIQETENKNAGVVVMLLPARTDMEWFHRALETASSIHFIRGRIKFEEAKSGAPFPSLVAVWQRYRASGGARVWRMTREGKEVAWP